MPSVSNLLEYGSRQSLSNKFTNERWSAQDLMDISHLCGCKLAFIMPNGQQICGECATKIDRRRLIHLRSISGHIRYSCYKAPFFGRRWKIRGIHEPYLVYLPSLKEFSILLQRKSLRRKAFISFYGPVTEVALHIKNYFN